MPAVILLSAVLWGFAEATLFFIVPDVLVSFVALRFGLKAGLKASFAAAVAATFGGAAMYLWAAGDPAGATGAIVALPAIDGEMVAVASAAFAEGGYGAMLRGAFSGVPYKIYAAAAGETGRSLPLLFLMTPLVRLPRFLLAATAVAAVDRFAAPRLSLGARTGLLAAFWMAFYVWYFGTMP